MYNNERKKIQLLKQKVADIEAQCRNENRQPYEIEIELMNELRQEADHIERSLPGLPETLTLPKTQGDIMVNGCVIYQNAF